MTGQPTTGSDPGTGRDPDEAAVPTPVSQVDEDAPPATGDAPLGSAAPDAGSLTGSTDPVDPK